MKTNHTPGPWEVFEDDFNEILIQYKDGVVVDRVGTLVSNDEIENEKLRADAKLIAAAPNLLEACDRMRDALEQTIHIIMTNNSDLQVDCGDYRDDLELGINAIKKATE